MITGGDIVKGQIHIAMKEPLSYDQSMIELKGFSIEVRLNAENPTNNFLPSSGHIQRVIFPMGGLGLRVESGVYSNYQLPPFYDSMIAKVISHGATLQEALSIMKRALNEVLVEGLTTNIELLQDLMDDQAVWQTAHHTRWLQETFMPKWLSSLDDSRKE